MGNVAEENGHFQVGNHFSTAFVPTAAPVLADGNPEFAIATSAYFGSLNLEFGPRVGAYHQHVPGLCLLHSRGVLSSGEGELKCRKNSKVL